VLPPRTGASFSTFWGRSGLHLCNVLGIVWALFPYLRVPLKGFWDALAYLWASLGGRWGTFGLPCALLAISGAPFGYLSVPLGLFASACLVRVFVCVSVSLFVYLFLRLYCFVLCVSCQFDYLCMSLFGCVLVRSFVRLFVCVCVCLLVRLLIC